MVIPKIILLTPKVGININPAINVPQMLPIVDKDDIFPEGNGWEVVSESSFEEGKKNQVNPAFAKLKILLDNQDDKNSDK